MAAIVTGWIIGVLGVLLAAGGAWLATLGDTWAYIVLGLGWAVTGALLIARRRAALWVYAALLLFTLVWSLFEAGLDRWALAPRCALFWLVGLWLLTPWVSDWRWQLGREDNPWYPTMRLFRQAEGEAWPAVIDRLVGELSAVVTGDPPRLMPFRALGEKRATQAAAIIAAQESSAARQAIDESTGTFMPRLIACTSRKTTCKANHRARFMMTPTTAAVIAPSAADSALLPRSASM